MSEASVIGLGAMGSALARAFLRDGHRVTVWNRTSAKAELLVRDGAVLAPSAALAVSASPIVVVCVDNYEVTKTILGSNEVAFSLSDRVLVQLSTGSPQEARDSEAWVRDQGAEYLDGAIMAFPDQIATPDAMILLSGAESAFQRSEPLLKSLAGELSYVGPQVGAASALDTARSFPTSLGGSWAAFTVHASANRRAFPWIRLDPCLPISHPSWQAKSKISVRTFMQARTRIPRPP